MIYEKGQRCSCFEVTSFVMDLHYPKWDTQAREESDIPERIKSQGSFYEVKVVSISDIDEPDYYIDDNVVEEYSRLSQKTMPPIVLSKIYGSYEIIDGCHRFMAVQKAGRKSMLAFIPVD